MNGEYKKSIRVAGDEIPFIRARRTQVRCELKVNRGDINPPACGGVGFSARCLSEIKTDVAEGTKTVRANKRPKLTPRVINPSFPSYRRDMIVRSPARS